MKKKFEECLTNENFVLSLGHERNTKNLMVYIQAKGLTFETESDLQNIMKQWINDGMTLTNKLQTPQGMEFMYQVTTESL
jgi:hypothetical protein